MAARAAFTSSVSLPAPAVPTDARSPRHPHAPEAQAVTSNDAAAATIHHVLPRMSFLLGRRPGAFRSRHTPGIP